MDSQVHIWNIEPHMFISLQQRQKGFRILKLLQEPVFHI